MSVTFWMPQAPTEKVTPYPDAPEYQETRPVAPFTEVNMSNSNAYALMELIDPSLIQDGYVLGTWDLVDLPIIRQQIIRVLNTKAKEVAYLDPFIQQEPGRCKVYEGGRDEQYVRDRLNSLLALLATAMEHGFSVSIG